MIIDECVDLSTEEGSSAEFAIYTRGEQLEHQARNPLILRKGTGSPIKI